MSVLVDIEEVRALVRGPSHGDLTIVAFKQRMQVNGRAVRQLIAAGHLKTITVANPVNRRRSRPFSRKPW